METFDSVRILAFDVFGTVVDWRSSVAAEGRKLGRAKGIEIDWGAFADRWRSLYRPSLDRIIRGEARWARLDHLHRESLERVLEEFGISAAFDEQEKSDFNYVWHRLEPWPDSVPGLHRLKRRFLVSTLSNGNLALLANMAKRANLPWDLILSAENVRRYKPEREVYLLPAELFEIDPDRVMLVAAHEHDLRGAQQHGLRTAFVHRPLEHGPDRAVPLPPAGRYDLIARDFIDLASQMGL